MHGIKRIACLHAHHGNIAYLDAALSSFRVDARHFVDPALVRRIADDPGFSERDAQDRVREQLGWMARSGADGIVVTCTAYVAAMPPGPIDGVTVPILPIDEPFFAAVCRAQDPQAILFTNPGTVDGTMRRLHDYAATLGADIAPIVEVIPDTFDLFMAGKQEEHDANLAQRLASYGGLSVRVSLCRATVDDGRGADGGGCREPRHRQPARCADLGGC
jgi:hypothetical protein